MTFIIKGIVTISFLVTFIGAINAQSKPTSSNPTVINTTDLSRQEVDRKISTELLPGQEANLRQLGRNTNVPAEGIRNDKLYSKAVTKLLTENRIDVSKEYSDKYISLLKDKKIQLAKIVPSKCNDGTTVSVQDIENCANTLQTWGGGSYYSFRNKTNYNTKKGVWADIRLSDNKFIVGSQTVQGIISRIGDMNIENIDIDSPEMRFLVQYKPKKELTEIRLQKQALGAGLSSNGYTYSDLASVKLDSTYVVRSVAYSLKYNEFMDKRSDIFVAFKVVGIEKDGSVVLLWKELKSNDAPSMKEENY